jgi:hypothetical protein
MTLIYTPGRRKTSPIGRGRACGGGENYSDELGISSFRLVKFQGDDETFPLGAFAFTGGRLALVALLVGFGADHENELGLLNLIAAPPRPPLGRRELVLVNPAIDAVVAQAFAEVPNAALMLRRVVTVADEHSHGRALRKMIILFSKRGV